MRKSLRRLRKARKLNRGARNFGKPRFILAAAFALFLPRAVNAATLIWDPAGDKSNTGSGLWDTTTPIWNDGTVNPDVNWSNAGNDTARFLGGNGMVTLNQPITAGGLLF